MSRRGASVGPSGTRNSLLCLIVAAALVAGCTASSPTTTGQLPAPISATPNPAAVAPATPTAIEQEPKPPTPARPAPLPVIPSTRTGAGALVDQDFAALHNRRVGLIAHRASMVDGKPLAVLIDEHPLVELVALFAPEHGLYGEADAGAAVADLVDRTTGAPVYSLYGTDRAPTTAMLAEVDVLVYDLQDVGVRFYTYTSTLGLAMQAAAQADIDFVVLDRPNPLGGDHFQGPTLTAGLESFIGLYNVPAGYGLTAGELATLIKRERLLPGLEELNLRVVPMQDWTRSMRWIDTELEWISPSPNLPTADSALIYPGTVLFEATSISEGRGTDEPFTLIGAPWIDGQSLVDDLTSRKLPGVAFEAATFTPRSIPGAAESPRFLGEQLAGVRIRVTEPQQVVGVEVGLHVLDAILRQGEQAELTTAAIINRPDVFDRLAGASAVRINLIAGTSVDEIRASFTADHQAFADLAATVYLYD